MKGSLVKSAIIVSLSIFGSRILGLLRDVTIASFFGAGSLTDTFFVAFRIPNLLRRIFAEGAFGSAFVPEFSRKLELSREEAKQFASQFLGTLLFFLILTLLLGEVFSESIVKLVAPGFSNGKFSYAVKLLREMFPYILLVSLVAFYGGILNGLGHFFAPNFSTALFNLSLILSAVFFGKVLSVEALAFGVVLGGILQVLLQVYFLSKKNFIFKPHFTLSPSREVLKTLKNTIPGIFGFAVRQFSMLIDTVIASFLESGAISYLYYANRFVQLPLGMFAVGISQVLLPRLAVKREREFLVELKKGILLCSAVVIPSSLGLVFFGKPIVDVVFNHGAFNEKALVGTYWVLVGYSVGLFFFSLEKLITNAFYSLGEFKLPVKVSACTLILNLFVDVLLCFGLKLKTFGLALGTSITSFSNVILLTYFLNKNFNLNVSPFVFRFWLKYSILSLPVCLISLLGERFYFSGIGTFYKVLTVSLTITFSALVYILFLTFLKDEVISTVKEG